MISCCGSGVPDQASQLASITCPVQFHSGGSDPCIPRDKVRHVEEAAAGRPDVEIHAQEDAGHAFHNRRAPMFRQPEPGSRAWQRTEVPARPACYPGGGRVSARAREPGAIPWPR